MAKIRGRAFQDPDEKLVKDLDPEANGHQSDGSSDNDSGDDGNTGTEHYVAVGKSRLREKEGLSLGRNYRGSRVSRQALEEESEEDEDENEDDDDDEEDDEEYDDPETADLEADTAQAGDSEIESDEALADSDTEQLKDFVFRGSSKPKTRKRATAADYMSSSGGEEEEAGGADVDGSEEDEDEEMDDGLEALVDGIASEEDEEEDEEDDEDEEDEEDEGEEDEEEEDEEDEDEEEEEEDAKKDAKPAAAAPSNQSEAEKGLAILEQRKIYDGLLNMRIRLQKALVATNTLPTLEDSAPSEAEAYEAAESAAIKLLNTMSGLRQNLTPASAAAGLKRKRDAILCSAPTAEIWERLQQEDADAARFRQDRLEKWSRKVQSVNVAAAKLGAPKQRTLVGALQEQLAAPGARLAKRTQVPRSCAPVQAAARVAESAAIYDDADFYQLLLKELVDQRTVESAAEQSGAVASVMVTANKEAKMRKVVDRKASKGRKMRFTVHEKLQNFMAPEDRRSWEQEAIDRFFGTLLGQKLELNEDEDENEDEEEDDEAAALYNTDSGLRLFR